ncbi:unnamed protein product [Schistocephalus solidus]|uniref:Golgi SNAP receptor complex member 1 n=1 Tax=Schistocephalus solidus TaxID=70667 RepID=A0A183SRV3_SCHSO|nr:unnamed protein product [Schistocephalus solidus]
MKKTWTELRSESRTLESDIDTKLAEHGRLGGGTFCGPHSDLMQKYNTSTDKLQYLLTRLDVLVSEMAVSPEHASRSYAIQRYREILFDYKQEFKRLKVNLLSNREHCELLRSTSSGIHLEMSNQGNASMSRLLEGALKRIPAINTVLSSTTFREHRDSFILGSGVGFCVLLSLFYLFR